MNWQNIALSGLAMIFIVLNHTIHLIIEYAAPLGYWQQDNLNYYALWILQALGSFAVPIFLFISGSFVAYAARGEPPKLTRKFLQSGLTHIIMPYLLWSVVFYFVLYINRGTLDSPIQYIKHLLVGYPFHFIPLLVFFYMISPILVPIAKRFSWLLVLGFLLYQLFLLNIKYPGILGLEFPSWTNIFVIPILGDTMAEWGVCFPIGIVFSLNMQKIRPWLSKSKWVIFSGAVISFLLALLDAQGFVSLPLTRFIGPILLLLIIPVIPRNSIPSVRRFEDVGKRSYGIYLTHLIILDLILLTISKFIPTVIQFTLILTPIILLLGLFIPIKLMDYFSKSSLRKFYRYVFG